jgi:hypothetical protein
LKERAKSTDRWQDSQACADVVRELQGMYRQTFACTWPATPWGATWPEVVTENRIADARHVAAMTALDQLHEALKAAGAVVDAVLARAPDSNDIETLEGLTQPEASLASIILAGSNASLEHHCLEALGEVWDWECRARLRKPSTLDRIRVQMSERAPPEAFRDFCNALYRATASRMMVSVVASTSTGSSGPYWLAAVQGETGRAIGSTEWLRGTLIAVLKDYPPPNEPISSPPAEPARFSSRDIALVSLLCGAPGSISKANGVKGVSEVVAAERRAIHEQLEKENRIMEKRRRAARERRPALDDAEPTKTSTAGASDGRPRRGPTATRRR